MSTVQAAENKSDVEVVTSPSVDRDGVELALQAVEAQISAQEDAHKTAIARLTLIRDSLRTALDPEGRVKELITALDLERQFHEECLATLRHFGFTNGGDALPSFDTVSHSFKLAELEAASRFQSPKLVPKVPFAAAVRSINAHKTMPNQIDTYINEGVYGKIKDDESNEQNAGWRFSIVEGAEEMDFKAHDNTKLTLGERIRLAEANREKAARGINRHEYAFLQMDGLRRKKPLDRKTWTVLDDDEALSASQFPNANWNDVRVFFDGVHPQFRNDDARFRSSVGGDVLSR